MKYGYTIESHDCGRFGTIQYAHWNHPLEGETCERISEHVISQYQQWVKPGTAAIDIGAHTGDSTVAIAAAMGSGVVLAYEPNIHVFEVLAENALLNQHIATIIPYPLAVSKGTGIRTFHYTDDAYCNGGDVSTLAKGKGAGHNHHPLNVVCIDGKTIMPQRLVSFIKCDTEGCDYEALVSLQKLIERDRPTLKVEFYTGLTDAEKVRQYEFIRSMGYAVFNLSGVEIKNVREMLNNKQVWDSICQAHPIKA